MSAFLCSENHINTLISYAVSMDMRFYHNEENHSVLLDPQGYAQILHSENVRSLEFRYGKDPETPEEIKFKTIKVDQQKDAVKVIKACHCYNYQACETEDYEETEAFSLISKIINNASRNIPGYDSEAWGIE